MSSDDGELQNTDVSESGDKEPEPFSSDYAELDRRGDELWSELQSGDLDPDEYNAAVEELRADEAARIENDPPDWAEDADEGPENWAAQLPDRDSD